MGGVYQIVLRGIFDCGRCRRLTRSGYGVDPCAIGDDLPELCLQAPKTARIRGLSCPLVPRMPRPTRPRCPTSPRRPRTRRAACHGYHDGRASIFERACWIDVLQLGVQRFDAQPRRDRRQLDDRRVTLAERNRVQVAFWDRHRRNCVAVVVAGIVDLQWAPAIGARQRRHIGAKGAIAGCAAQGRIGHRSFQWDVPRTGE